MGALRRNDLVEVRSPREILSTLDERGRLAGLPFMPEMTTHCGRRFLVDRRANKVCDTIHYTGSRCLVDGVLLADLRCSGAAHGGCQAECRLFWKEAWLRRVSPDSLIGDAGSAADMQALLDRIGAAVKRTSGTDGQMQERWSCQATELTGATQHVRLWDPRAYIGQYTSGNVELGHCLRVTTRAAVEEPLRKLHLMPQVFVRGTASAGVRGQVLGLQPGDWVRVRSKEEIAATLTPEGYNRGMWFDREMLVYCGGTFRVRRRITRFIDERLDSGRMVELKSDAVTLERVVCSGELSQRRWFCPREIYPYWRECWLERVPGPTARDMRRPSPVESSV